ncbi:restriction endonuclease, partial [Clostridium perfringens]|nr:restriction endonuclease [Clostridium perfringens]
MDSNLIERNADDPSRATNSGNTNYTIVPQLEKLISSYSN